MTQSVHLTFSHENNQSFQQHTLVQQRQVTDKKITGAVRDKNSGICTALITKC